jgi:hypothetical protein
MRVFVAGSFLDKEKVRKVQAALRQAGHEITHDWTQHDGTDDPRILREQALADEKGVRDAQVLIVVLPGRFGTHAEVGMALISRKPVIFVGNQGDMECLYFHHPLAMRVESIDECVMLLNMLCEKYGRLQ